MKCIIYILEASGGHNSSYVENYKVFWIELNSLIIPEIEAKRDRIILVVNFQDIRNFKSWEVDDVDDKYCDLIGWQFFAIL